MKGAGQGRGDELLAGEEEAAIVVNEKGSSPVFLVCEHAGRLIPKKLGTLGLPDEELNRHIAYDIGAGAVARRLSQVLDSTLVLQRYSRLVYDCNRPPDSPSAMPELSELTRIPGNLQLSETERRKRVAAIYEPFHGEAGRLLDLRLAKGRPTIFVTIHSFTPVFKSISRRMHVGLLFDRDRRFTDILGPLIAEGGRFDVRYNEPYGPEDGVCHTLNVHAGARGLAYSMIEIRNDLIESESGQAEWADRLAGVLQRAVNSFLRSTETAAFHTGA